MLAALGAVLSDSEEADGRSIASFTVTVTVGGDGNGWVRGPGGLASFLRCGVGTARTPRDVCSQSVPEEALPYRLVAVPADDGSIEGSWAGCDVLEPNPSGLTCVIIEGFDRSVSGTVNLRTAPGGGDGETPPVLTEADKKGLRKFASDFDTAADNYWGIAIISGALGVAPVSIMGAIFGIAHKSLGNEASKMAEDPPDPRYKRLSQVRRPLVARVRSARGITPALARALTALRVEAARLDATLEALLRSVERGQGAAEAKDSPWVGRHQRAAAEQARAAATLLERMPRLRANVARVLRQNVRVTPEQVRRARAALGRSVLPSRLRADLRAVGFSTAALAEATRMARAARPPARATSAKAALADARVRSSERTVAAALRRFARRTAGPLR